MFPACSIPLPGPIGDLVSVSETVESDSTPFPLLLLVLGTACLVSRTYEVRHPVMILEQGLWTLPLKKGEEHCVTLSFCFYLQRGLQPVDSSGVLVQELCEDKV